MGIGDPSAPASVFVHETATAGAAWRPVAERLAERGHRALVYDRRGWADSTAPPGYSRTTVEEQSEDLAELISAAGGVSLVCGAGLGGLIALDLLLRHPQAARAAVLVEPLVPGLVPAATEALSEDRESLREAVQDRGAEGMLDRYLSGELHALGPGVERLPASLVGPARERPGALAAELGAASAWSQPLSRLAEPGQAIVIVTCTDTPVLLREAADALAERLTDGRRSEMAGSGPPQARDPEWLVELVSSSVPR